MNMSRLMQYASKKEEEKQQLRTKQLKVVQLQQDLFVMTVEAVYKELEEQKIWNITPDVKAKFDAASMYERVLKQDIAWRKWQWFVREQITNYLREHNMVRRTTEGNDSQSKPTLDGECKGDGDEGVEADEVTLFLRHYKLDKYDDRLREAGLESLSDLKSLDKESVWSISNEVAMQTLHKNKFVQACQDLNTGRYPPEEISKLLEVDHFLQKFNLGRYGSKLKRNGLATLVDIQAMNEEEISALATEVGMGVLHKKKFIAACKGYKDTMKQMKGRRRGSVM